MTAKLGTDGGIGREVEECVSKQQLLLFLIILFPFLSPCILTWAKMVALGVR